MESRNEWAPSTKTRNKVVASSILFSMLLILCLVFEGDPSNTLHTSSLSWAFSLLGVSVLGYIGVEAVDYWNMIRHGSKNEKA